MSFLTTKLAAVGAAILAVLAIAWRIFAAGENKQIAKEQKAKLEAIKDKKAKDDEINSLSPADLDRRFKRWMRD